MVAPLLPMSVGHYIFGASVICGARHDIIVVNPLVVAAISQQVSAMSAGASHSMEQAMAQAMARDTEQEQYVRQCLRYHGASSHMRSHTQVSVCSLVALHSYIHSFIAACSYSNDIVIYTSRHIDTTSITRYYSYLIAIYTCIQCYHRVLHCALLSLQVVSGHIHHSYIYFYSTYTSTSWVLLHQLLLLMLL